MIWAGFAATTGLDMEKIPFTQVGLDRLKEELNSLKHAERQAVIKAIAEAREHGDLSENAEYHAARERQSFIAIKDCRSRAAWYSAFSDRSPCSRASAIALITACRSACLRELSSSFSRSRPTCVNGIFSISNPVVAAKPAQII